VKPDEPGKPKSEEALDELERARLGEMAGGHAEARFGDWQGNDLRKPEQALQALREVEKAKLTLEAIELSGGHFADMAVNSLLLVGDLATDAIRRIEAAKHHKESPPPGRSDDT
jgi:hypothetical protein